MKVDGRLTITDLAKELGVTTKTISRWEKAGKIIGWRNKSLNLSATASSGDTISSRRIAFSLIVSPTSEKPTGYRWLVRSPTSLKPSTNGSKDVPRPSISAASGSSLPSLTWSPLKHPVNLPSRSRSTRSPCCFEDAWRGADWADANPAKPMRRASRSSGHRATRTRRSPSCAASSLRNC